MPPHDEAGAQTRDADEPVTGGDGQAYTVAELRDRVSLAEPNIVVIREIYVGSPDALEVMLERARELVDTERDFAVVVDLVDTQGKVPAEYRRAIPEMLNAIDARHVAIALYANPVVRAASRFIAHRIGPNVTIHKDSNDAIAAARSRVGSTERRS